MYANVLIKEPLDKVMEDWDFFQDKIIGRFSTFMPEGQNILGLRRRNTGDGQQVDPKKGVIGQHLELGPAGVVPIHFSPMNLHVTLGGTPHHTEHNYGYWHVNDMDELSLKVPNPDPNQLGYALLCMGNPGPGESDRFVWYCDACLTLMYERQYQTGERGFFGFWKAERDAVNSYNADPQNQVCQECGHVNPKAYCWNAAKDTPDESAARRAW